MLDTKLISLNILLASFSSEFLSIFLKGSKSFKLGSKIEPIPIAKKTWSLINENFILLLCFSAKLPRFSNIIGDNIFLVSISSWLNTEKC